MQNKYAKYLEDHPVSINPSSNVERVGGQLFIDHDLSGPTGDIYAIQCSIIIFVLIRQAFFDFAPERGKFTSHP